MVPAALETTPKTAIFRHIRRFWETPSPSPKTYSANGKLPPRGMRVILEEKSVFSFIIKGYHTAKASSLFGLSRNRGLSTLASTSEPSLSTQGLSPSVSASATASKVLSRLPRLTRNQGLSPSRSPSLVSACSVSSSLGNNIKSFLCDFCKGLPNRVVGRYPTGSGLSVLYRSIERLLERAKRPASPVVFCSRHRPYPGRLLRGAEQRSPGQRYPGQPLCCYPGHRSYPGQRRRREGLLRRSDRARAPRVLARPHLKKG